MEVLRMKKKTTMKSRPVAPFTGMGITCWWGMLPEILLFGTSTLEELPEKLEPTMAMPWCPRAGRAAATGASARRGTGACGPG
eukprot:CAMPEP_0194566820 /NCGR_PEP_ID=MMETSP0292-20121207/5541_1 /TAXON_ID=39354 /ORGANISM="Heterosigma akashiwo, Strain CCMP2393" /LENGTH=82 /DNA_ID=CAMNT_0039416463 /DNA_START=402 /DNA_END=647 /DNA_ORIENTATION=+